MINRIIKIKGVGKFFDFSLKASSLWNGEFRPITLIYGENGIGKSTLTSILRSLKNDDSLVYQLRSFGINDSPEVILKFDDEAKNIEYKNGEWDKNKKNIEIFDTHFINTNIFTGFEILPQHRKNLFEIVIGDEGVSLKYQISNLKNQIKEKNNDLKDISRKVAKFINVYEIDEILLLQFDFDIETKISKKQKEIDASRAFEKIKLSPVFREMALIDYEIRYENLKAFCQKSIDNISQEYIEKVENHKNSLNLKNRSEKWIKDGVDNIQNNKCPFCLQNIETVDIVKAYTQYFNEQYIAMQRNTKLLQNKVKDINLEQIFSNIEIDYASNNGYFKFWSSYLNIEIVELSITNFKKQTIEITRKLKELVDLKSNNPIKPVEIDIINELEKILNEGNQEFIKYNEIIKRENLKIKALKEKEVKDVNILEKELEKLKAIKIRQTEEVKKLCSAYQKNNKEITDLKIKNSDLQTQLKQYTFKIFSSYKEQINNYLQKFAPYLEIRELKSTYRGGGKDPFADYGLYVSGNKIDFKADSMNPNVKYSLSEGDKSALAISFFLAKVFSDNNIEKKIIVFDDPISSFDINRKTSTISHLYQLSQKANQLIVLTHNLLFARDFWEKVKKNTQSLRLSFIRNSTVIADYDIESETINGLFKDFSMLDNYLTFGVSSDTEKRNVARCIRPIIEGYFRIKFYGQFNANEWLGDFLKKISISDDNSILSKLKIYYSDLDEINDFAKKFHHTNPNADSESIYDSELEKYVKNTFEIIAKI